MTQPAWKDIAEAVGIVAIVLSLILLVIEVRDNTAAVARQTALDRVAFITEPFFDSDLSRILAKIKAVDSENAPQIVAFMKAYDLTHEEAITWDRHLWLIWEVLEAEYLVEGASQELDNQIRTLLSAPDNQVYVDLVGPYRFSTQFAEHVRELRG
jgi:hypothetical protein